MDSLILGKDIQVAYISATNLQDGTTMAREKLKALFPDSEERRTFRISTHYGKGDDIYKVGIEASPSEVENLELETMIIKHGAYMSFYITDYRNDLDRIPQAFALLKGQHEADPNANCIEWFIGDDDVKCLVRSGPEDYPDAHL